MIAIDSLRFRILGGKAAFALGMLLIAALALSALRSVRATIDRDVQSATQLQEAYATISLGLFDQLRAAEGYLANAEASNLERFHAASRLTHREREHVLGLPSLSVDHRLGLITAGELQALSESWYAYSHRQRALGRSTELAADSARFYAGLLVTHLRAHLGTESISTAQAGNRIAAAIQDRETTLWLVLFLTGLAGVGIATATIRGITLPLTKLINIASRFSRGDLRPATVGDMPEELAAVGTAITTMGSQLRTIVQEVNDQCNRIASTAADLSAASEELAASGDTISRSMVEVSHRARDQVQSLQEGRAAMSRLRNDADRNVKRTRLVADDGQRIHDLAARHGKDITAAANALLELGQLVQTSAEQVEILNQLSASIDDFVDMIKDVSSQTNLLAVNAAIEAARASVGGEGFAVVADEVRQLADSSSSAADDAAKSIVAVRRQLSEVVETMSSGRARVGGVGAIATGAAGALTEIERVVTSLQTMARELKDTVHANREASERVVHLMDQVSAQAEAHAEASENVSAAAEEQGASTEEIAGQAADLNLAAERLRELIADLRT